MDDSQLLRYSRHILLDEIGVPGQTRLLSARVLLVGAGGLGSPVALYLAASGIGRLTICDDDQVELSNLQRQIAHPSAAIGANKARSAVQSAHALNPTIALHAIEQRVQGDALLALVSDVDLVVDASDNFATRHAVNRACVAMCKPLVSGAAIRFDGQVAVFDFRNEMSPCYHCLFQETNDPDETRCAENGVFAPLTGIIGATQAAEAIKLIAGCGETLTGKLLLLDSLSMSWRTLRLKRDPGCAVCAARGTAS